MHLTGYELVVNDDTQSDDTPCEHISLEECQFVAEKLGIIDTFITEDETQHPPNCYINRAFEVVFNNNTSDMNTVDCDFEAPCVCQRDENREFSQIVPWSSYIQEFTDYYIFLSRLYQRDILL